MVYEHGIEPHVTVFDKSARKDGTFSRDDFTYDHEHDVYHCLSIAANIRRAAERPLAPRRDGDHDPR
jgi:hypothetical protein